MIDYVTTKQFETFLREEAEHHAKDEEYMRSVGVQVAAVGQQVAGLGVQLSTSQRIIEKHDKDLYGNGEIGMDERLRQIGEWMERWDAKEIENKEKVKEAKEEEKALQKEKRENQQFWIRFAIITIVTNILAVVGSATIWLFKILPILNALQK